MDTNWQHQKRAIATDQKNRSDDEHIHEQDKQNFEASRKEALPPNEETGSGAEDAGEDVGLGRKRE